MPPLSPGCLWVCSTLPFDESSPPVCSMLPRIVPPFCTSSVPVISLLVQTTSGVSRVTRVDAFTVTTGTVAVTESEAVTLAVLIPLNLFNHLHILTGKAEQRTRRIINFLTVFPVFFRQTELMHAGDFR